MLQLAQRVLYLLSLTVPSCVSPPLSLLFSSGPDVFALGEVVTSAHAQNVLYCVASNFLEVKLLASTLLRQLPHTAVGLQVNRGPSSVTALKITVFF